MYEVENFKMFKLGLDIASFYSAFILISEYLVSCLNYLPECPRDFCNSCTYVPYE